MPDQRSVEPMSGGVRAELAIHDPENCPLATLSARTDAAVTDVTWAGDGDEAVVEEFRIPSGADVDGIDDATSVVDVGEKRVYRFDRDTEASCPCAVVESLGSPLADVRLREGTLHLTLHPESVERLRSIVTALDDAAVDVELEYLAHAGDGGGDGADRSVVDWSHLTDRQREVLRTAHRMGYFEYPRRANATAVADELDIGLSTFTEHLAAAQGTLLDDLLFD
jgi:predicted DNA binding protein